MGMTGGGGQNPQCALMGAQNSMGKSCPNLISVPVALNNAMAITSMYPTMELGGSTPTHKALKVVVDHLIQQTASPDSVMNPQYIILATDGEPNDLCVGGKGGDGSLQRQCVISAVDRAAAAKVRTFVISLAGNDKKLQEHLVEVAKHGDPTNAMAHPYSPMNPNELVMALKTVLTAAVGCDLK
jgi:hypothetical protein